MDRVAHHNNKLFIVNDIMIGVEMASLGHSPALFQTDTMRTCAS